MQTTIKADNKVTQNISILLVLLFFIFFLDMIIDINDINVDYEQHRCLATRTTSALIMSMTSTSPDLNIIRMMLTSPDLSPALNRVVAPPDVALACQRWIKIQP